MDDVADELDSAENSCEGDFHYNMERLALINRFAFVYTTKLEDTSLLQKDINKYNTKEITQMLLVESKPVYSPINTNYMKPVLDSSLGSYEKVINFVEQMNSKAILENTALRICRSCTVLLIDYRLFPGKSTPGMQNKKKRFNNVHRTHDSTSEGDDLILVNEEEKEFNTCLVILVDNANQAHIYRVNFRSEIVTDSYVMANFTSKRLKVLFPREVKHIRYYCCWFRKENIINELTPTRWNPIKKFLRTRHTCFDGDCQCCCRDSDMNSTKRRTKGRELKEATKYLEYTLLLINKKNNDNTPPMSKNTLHEFYEIGKGGEIVQHYKNVNTDKVKNIINEYTSLGMKIIKKEYCCWYNRDNIIHSLFASTTLKFFKIPHACKTHICECCCKPKNTSLLQRVRKIESTKNSWPEVLQSTTIYNKASNDLHISETDLKKHFHKADDKLNVLNKFKDLKMGVNTEGKLEVHLDTPAKNLSNVELKILYHILSISLKQIQQLQISPQEFCQRVNSKQRAPIPPVHNITKNLKVPENVPSVSSIIPNVSVRNNTPEPSTETLDSITSEIILSEDITSDDNDKHNVYKQFSLLMGKKGAFLANKFKQDPVYGFSSTYVVTVGYRQAVPNLRAYLPPPEIKKLQQKICPKKKRYRPITKEQTNTLGPKITSVESLNLKRKKQSPDRQTLKRRNTTENKKDNTINEKNQQRTKETRQERESSSKLINAEVDKSLVPSTNLITVPMTQTPWETASIIQSPQLITIQESNSEFTGTNLYIIDDKIVATSDQNVFPVINNEHTLSTIHVENNTVISSSQIVCTNSTIDDNEAIPILPVSNQLSGLSPLSNGSNFHTENDSTFHEMLLGPVTMDLPSLTPIAKPASYHDKNTPADIAKTTYSNIKESTNEDTIQVTQIMADNDSKMNIEVTIHRDDLLEWPYSP